LKRIWGKEGGRKLALARGTEEDGSDHGEGLAITPKNALNGVALKKQGGAVVTRKKR